jgi:hypothetical protein
MIKELDRVVLTEDVVDYNLKAGDVGTVVMVHGEGEGFEVEFMALNGETIAVVTLLAAQVRPVQRGEITHVRKVATA